MNKYEKEFELYKKGLFLTDLLRWQILDSVVLLWYFSQIKKRLKIRIN